MLYAKDLGQKKEQRNYLNTIQIRIPEYSSGATDNMTEHDSGNKYTRKI